jgi:hypothetical protein
MRSCGAEESERQAANAPEAHGEVWVGVKSQVIEVDVRGRRAGTSPLPQFRRPSPIINVA